MRTVITPGKDTELIQLDLASVAEGETLELTSENEVLVVVLSGVVDVEIDGAGLGSAGHRKNVFEGPGDAVYAPPGCAIRLCATAAAELAVASAPLADEPGGTPRIIHPDDQDVADRGDDNWARSVRTILGPSSAAGRLLVGETVNPPGNWSSYPPHKHDEQDPPREVQLEEVYLFKFDRPDGFGVQILYDGEKREAIPVYENDVATIMSGYHPVVGAPGYSLYYLWVMAGQGRQMIPYLDPRHAWVQEGR